MKTYVKVRAQAHGGKYIGPAVKQPPVLNWTYNGQVYGPQTFDNSNSGTVTHDYQLGVSPYTITVEGITQPPAGTYWLLPPSQPGQAETTVCLDIEEPVTVDFTVTAYATNDQSAPRYGSVSMAVLPGGDYTQVQPGLVVPVKGLRVYDFTASPQPGNAVSLSATVQMMCGCPITIPPAPSGVEGYWPDNEFEVAAYFLKPNTGILGPYPLACNGTSSFATKNPIPLDQGAYTVWLFANQSHMMNTGFAMTKVTVG